MNQNCVKIQCGNSSGSGFFVAPEYIITCWHVIEGSEKNDEITCNYKNEEFTAVVIDFSEKPPKGGIYNEESADLALLKIKSLDEKPNECKYCRLDRVPGKNGQAFGYPHGNEGQKFTGEIEITDENDKGLIILDQANSVTTGYSGGPICRKDDPEIAIGVAVAINEVDEDGHGSNIAYCIPAEKVLKLWGDKVCERRYEVAPRTRYHNDFVYEAFKTDFIDPYGYKDKLTAFANDDEPVLWWAVIGAGGAGKSRLAYEFAHSLNSSWHCELVRADELTVAYLDKLYKKAARDTLIIADYAYTDTNQLGAWLTDVAKDSTRYRHKVRVLLLQREDNDDKTGAGATVPWYEKLLAEHSATIKKLQFKEGENLKIEPLKREQIIEVMRSYASKMEANVDIDDDALYTVLENVDEELTRPLFAMFIVDAEIHGDNPHDWRKDDALSYFCDREQDILDQNIENQQTRKASHLLWVFATITGGYSFEDDKLSDLKFNAFYKAKDVGWILNEKGFAAGSLGQYTMPPMTPDLLGEFFVLQYFKDHPNDVTAIIKTTFTHNEEATRDFLTRLFTDHETDLDLVEKCSKAGSSIENIISWGLVFRPAIDLLSQIYNTNKTESWLVKYALGFFTHIYRQTDAANARGALTELENLYRNNKDNSDVMIVYADGLVNILYKPDKPNARKETFEKLKTLYEGNQRIDEIVIAYAGGLFNHFNNQTNPTAAKEALEELGALYEGNKHIDAVAVEYARGINNYLFKFNYSIATENFFSELLLLHKNNTDNKYFDAIDVLCAEGVVLYCIGFNNTKMAKVYSGLLYRHNYGNWKIEDFYMRVFSAHLLSSVNSKKQSEGILTKIGKLVAQHPQLKKAFELSKEIFNKKFPS